MKGLTPSEVVHMMITEGRYMVENPSCFMCDVIEAAAGTDSIDHESSQRTLRAIMADLSPNPDLNSYIGQNDDSPAQWVIDQKKEFWVAFMKKHDSGCDY